MSERTYVVTKDMDGLNRQDNKYVGPDPDKAKRLADDLCETDSAPRLHTFIEVWEDGEHQFTTREHPER